MKNTQQLNRSEHNKLYLLGVYQIVGGIYGIIMILSMLAIFDSYPSGKILISVFGVILFSYSVICGFVLLNAKFLKGLALTIYNNILQIIGFGISGYHFHYVSGIFVGLNLDLTEDTILGFGFDFSVINLAFNSRSELFFVTINVIAIIVLGIAFKMKERVEQKTKVI